MKISIIVTSDSHGYIYPFNYASNQPENIGILRFDSYIKALRKERTVFLLDNGDTIQGSPLSYFHMRFKDSSNPLAIAMNHMQYDIVNLGNHDFNYGQDYLSSYIQSLDSDVLCANMVKDNNPFLQKYLIKEVDGVSIGFINVCTHYIPNWESPKNIEGFVFQDAFETLRKEVSLLRENVDILIASYHGGFEKDLDSFKETERYTGENQGIKMIQEIHGIDVLITGHQHREIAEIVNDIAIVQPGSRGAYIGQIDLEIKDKEIIDKRVKLVGDESQEVPFIKELDSLHNECNVWLDQVVGVVHGGSLRVLNQEQARIHTHPLSNFINQVQLEISGADISMTSLANAASGFQENISVRDILASYVYSNTLNVIKINGKQLQEALNLNAQFFEMRDGEIRIKKKFMDPKLQLYNYDIFYGLTFEVVLGKPNIVQNVLIENKPLEEDKQYKLVLNSYRNSGGGADQFYQSFVPIKEISIDVAELIIDYVVRKKDIKCDDFVGVTFTK